jgi:hypothetical protein
MPAHELRLPFSAQALVDALVRWIIADDQVRLF